MMMHGLVNFKLKKTIGFGINKEIWDKSTQYYRNETD
jgi:hypothetical protein